MASTSSLFVDLHTHTTYSPDGWHSPETVVRTAAQRGVQLLSITDHNHIGAQARAKAEAGRLGVRYLTGVELDLVLPETAQTLHFLAYGFDPEHPAIKDLSAQQLATYDQRCRLILDGFAALGPKVDEGAVKEWLLHRYEGNPCPQLTYWGLMDWVVETRFMPDRAAFEARVAEVRATIPSSMGQNRPFTSLPSAVEAVHAAGGVILLAHVARYYPGDARRQLACIHSVIHHGADGFELYHPSNVADASLPTLEAAAREMACLLSCGSDTHRLNPIPAASTFGRVAVPDWVAPRLPVVGEFALSEA